ncbi:MAG: F0F1-type ATP synthase membrane subunit b/b' [Candidatus Promineifilaceae bacterium]|jgi:F0F1-type ATP synthase membrane subunit b/b'
MLTNLQESMGVILPIVIAHIVVLGAILITIKRMLVGDTVRAVGRIGDAESEIRKKEETMRQEMEQMKKEFASKRAGAEEDLQERREELEREMTQSKEATVDKAKREAGDLLEKARNEERRRRDRLGQEMESKAVDFAGRMFRLVFSERLNDALNRAFIDELIDALEDTDAAGITVDSDGTRFVASHPIEPDQKKRLQGVLKQKFQIDVKIDEQINEELLAGLVIKLGSLEIDGSLLSRYKEAATELKKDA